MAALLYVRNLRKPLSPVVISPHRNEAISTFLRHLALLTILFDIPNFPTHPHHPCRPYSGRLQLHLVCSVQILAAAFSSKGKWPCRTMTGQAPAFPFSQSTPNLVFLSPSRCAQAQPPTRVHSGPSMMKLRAAICGPPDPVNPPEDGGESKGSGCMKT
jgi:hypothetical protein